MPGDRDPEHLNPWLWLANIKLRDIVTTRSRSRGATQTHGRQSFTENAGDPARVRTSAHCCDRRCEALIMCHQKWLKMSPNMSRVCSLHFSQSKPQHPRPQSWCNPMGSWEDSWAELPPLWPQGAALVHLPAGRSPKAQPSSAAVPGRYQTWRTIQVYGK